MVTTKILKKAPCIHSTHLYTKEQKQVPGRILQAVIIDIIGHILLAISCYTLQQSNIRPHLQMMLETWEYIVPKSSNLNGIPKTIIQLYHWLYTQYKSYAHYMYTYIYIIYTYTYTCIYN